MMNLIKKLSEWSYPFLIVAGILVGPFGLMAGNPVVAGLGNAMFLAGIFTPMWILKEVTFKDAVVGGTLSATVLYFCFSGDIDGRSLAGFIPLLAASICLTRYSGVKLIAKVQAAIIENFSDFNSAEIVDGKLILAHPAR